MFYAQAVMSIKCADFAFRHIKDLLKNITLCNMDATQPNPTEPIDEPDPCPSLRKHICTDNASTYPMKGVAVAIIIRCIGG